MAGRVVFQVDQTKPEDQVICRHQQKCSADSNLDCDVCLSDSGIHQISVEAEEKYATDSAAIAAKPVRKTGLDGVASRGPTSHATDQYSANSFVVKVNGTVVTCYIKMKCL